MNLLTCLYAFGGSLAFAIIMNIRRNKLFYAAFGGFIAQFSFQLGQLFFDGDVFNCFLATLSIALYSEIMARLTASPTTIYLVVSLIPLVPGGSVYYTMLNFLNGDIAAGVETGLYTIAVSAALSMGIIIVSSTAKLIHQIRQNRKSNII
ncbi:threonine/serine exporter family protein [Eubacteriaceae bacterium ES3]|nr:threonine/serine exporter family protein [Eubacteriaceae bacterium ES3]